MKSLQLCFSLTGHFYKAPPRSGYITYYADFETKHSKQDRGMLCLLPTNPPELTNKVFSCLKFLFPHLPTR